MVHMHYSPFQFATDVQVSEHKVSVKAITAPTKRLTRKDKIAPVLLTRDEAHSIMGSPTAFISPNSVDVMRTAKSVFGC
jgi:hypothetical protein